MRARRPAPIRFAVLLGLVLAGLPVRPAVAAFGVDDPIHGFILEIALDADASGNTATKVDVVDAQRVASLGEAGSVSVDIVVDQISDLDSLGEQSCDGGGETGCGLTGIELEVKYDPQRLRIVGFDPNQLLCAFGCPNRVSQTETLPDQDGAFFVFELDDQSLPETGEGVLGRLSFECLAPGPSVVELGHPQTGVPRVFDASGGVYPVGVVTPATLVCLDAVDVPPNQEVTRDLSGDAFDDDDTGWRLFNAGVVAHKVESAWLPGSPFQPDDTVTPGFALVDGTLLVQSTAAPGEVRVRYRIEYDVRAVRRAGIRVGQVRLMRRDFQTGRWGRAVRAIQGRATGRYLPRTEADFVLGHHGFSDANSYVWAVVDVNSRYAIGGPVVGEAMPLLGPVALLALGVALLGGAGWELRRRS